MRALRLARTHRRRAGSRRIRDRSRREDKTHLCSPRQALALLSEFRPQLLDFILCQRQTLGQPAHLLVQAAILSPCRGCAVGPAPILLAPAANLGPKISAPLTDTLLFGASVRRLAVHDQLLVQASMLALLRCVSLCDAVSGVGFVSPVCVSNYV